MYERPVKIRIGYPCINRSIGCTSNHTFRLASYSETRMIETVSANLDCLAKILKFNADKGIDFFRISSDLIPFASHEICGFDWRGHFVKELSNIGRYIQKSGMRVSMHPDQFVLINAEKEDIVRRSVAELEYHAAVLDSMALDRKAKIQIHVGGVYGDKGSAIKRFVERSLRLSPAVSRRLVIENDDRSYSVEDCVAISRETGVPVLFDVFHHECLSGGLGVSAAFKKAAGTWKKKDGPFMIDYSEQDKGKREGAHAHSVNVRRFAKFMAMVRDAGIDSDIMMEIKDKEKSVLKVLKYISA